MVIIVKACFMFDLTKIVTGLNDLKELIEKNRLKNLRAELAGKFLDPKDCSPVTSENGDSISLNRCREAVALADVMLKALGETK